MKMIQTTKKTLTLLSLGLGMVVGLGAPVQSQPEADAPGMAQNPANGGAGNPAARAARKAARAGRQNKNKRAGGKGADGQMGEKGRAKMEERELAAAEAIAGKPLTDEQKTKVRESIVARELAVRTAREKYVTDMATSLGLDPDEVRLKLRQAMAKRNRAAAGAPAAGAAR